MNIRKVKSKLDFLLKHPVGRAELVLTFYRYIRFHVLHTIRPGERPYRFVGDTCIFVDRWMAGIRGNVFVRLVDFNEMCFLMHFLREGDVFFDVGANMGVYSILASGVCGSIAVAVEPVPDTFQYLCRNIELNDLNGLVRCENIGLAAKSGSLQFSIDKGAMNRVVDNNGVSIPVETMNHLANRCGCVPNLVKIDVEGFEYYVLEGGLETIENDACEAIIIELNGSGVKYGFTDFDTHNLLSDRGFLPVDYDPWGRFVSVRGSFNTDVYNTIYIKEKSMFGVQEKLKKASKVQVGGFFV